WPARRHSALGFLQCVHDLDTVLRAKKPLEFAFLRIDGLDLPVFLFRGFAAVDEVLHVGIGVVWRHSTGAAGGGSGVARLSDFASSAAISAGVGERRMR